MKKYFVNLFAVTALFSIATALSQPAFAQSAFDTGQSAISSTPTDAVRGSTSERTDAWNGLTETEQSDVLAQFKSVYDSALKQRSQRDTQPKNTAFSFASDLGVTIDSSGSIKYSNTLDLAFTPISRTTTDQPCTAFEIPCPGGDADVDGLADSVENSLADGFTPYYYVSTGEFTGTGFARFNNSVPQTIMQSYPAIPPISHYRVTPLGFGTLNGAQHGFIQIDYLTLWNRDDGLNISGQCSALTAGIGLSLNQLGSHTIDNERGAILVAAPTTTANTYNLTAASYKAYQFFTAAHEDTTFDHSLVFSPLQPASFGQHILLAFSRWKHGTYPFDPDGLPLFPAYIMASVYGTLSYLYLTGQINWYRYLALLYVADTVFFSCVVEHFGNQGGVFSGTRTNVGELNHPLNNSGFIQDPVLTQKLNKYF